MPFDLDYELNADGHVDCGAMDRIDKGIQAHSAALGLIFLQDSAFPASYRDGAVIALHGSWNRTVRTGYKVLYFPWNASAQTPGAQVELVKGWLDDNTQDVWGRPVDVAVGADGSLFISDDTAGAIYRLKQSQ
jgi:glucose/arabinose dehydrogenase